MFLIDKSLEQICLFIQNTRKEEFRLTNVEYYT